MKALNQARQTYLSAVVEFNRSQYRLLVATGTSSASPPSRR
jgi:hypothetical protein